MIKINSLDFINRAFFETDIMTADGRVLVKKGDKIEPKTLLRLYFKELYINEPLKTEIKEEQKIKDDAVEELVQINLQKEEQIEEPKENNDSMEKLEFDEDEAKRVSELSVKIGEKLNLSPDSIEELKQAAYYHNIGRTRLTKGELNKTDFKRKQSMEGYDILLNEKKLPLKIAETAKFYIQKYETNNQKLGDEIPYANIVAITSYYDELLTKGLDKEVVLDKMLRLGGNRFNIFVLHKFIRMMKEETL